MAFPTTPALDDTHTIGTTDYIFNGVAWDISTVKPTATMVETEFVATEGQTVFTADYIVGLEEVFHNGYKLPAEDYITDVSGTFFTLVTPATLNDIVVLQSYNDFQVADVYTQAQADAAFEPIDGAIQTHITAVTGNPHVVTATDVNLGNVTNESKATMFTSPTFTGTVSGVDKTMVGLANVDNTSDATKNAATATLTNKTITNLVLNGAVTEQVAVCNLALEPDNGTVQTYTATADFILTDGLAEGQFVTLVLINGGWTPTYPVGIEWWADEVPVLQTKDKLFFEKIGGILYGTHTGSRA